MLVRREVGFGEEERLFSFVEESPSWRGHISVNRRSTTVGGLGPCRTERMRCGVSLDRHDLDVGALLANFVDDALYA